MENNKKDHFYTTVWLIIRIIIGFGANIFTSYWLVRGFKNPEIIGFVKDHSGNFIQPDTLLLQITGYLMLLLIHVIILFGLIYKCKSWLT